MSTPDELDISLWLVGVEENLLGRTLTDRDGGPPRTCPYLKVNSEHVSQRRHIWVFYPTRYNLKIQFQLNTPVCSFHSCSRLFNLRFYAFSSDIRSLQIKYHYHSFFTLHTSLHSLCAPPPPSFHALLSSLPPLQGPLVIFSYKVL